MLKLKGWWGILALLLWVPVIAHPPSPSILYLSWVDDPSTSMLIQWHAKQKMPMESIAVRKVGESKWKHFVSTSRKIEGTKYSVRQVDLKKLSPDTEYEFQLRAETHRFRTMPASLDRAIQFGIGGDIYSDLDRYELMSRELAARSPEFVVLGGDIAYAYGHSWAWGKGLPRWRAFLKAWRKDMVTPDGRLIPLLPVLGNHDMRTNKPGTYRLFEALFPRAQPLSYAAIDMGDYLSLFLLDTGHIAPIDGEQTRWLDGELLKRKDVRYRFAVYHKAGYPSVYPYEGKIPQQIRENWSPLFEKHGVRIAFENHNHAYKRTYPILDNKVDPAGVIYLGDGAWGVPPRQLKNASSWYLEKAESANAIAFVILDKERIKIEVLTFDGRILDSMVLK